jgi:anti-sigma regulatory factor (Ser/Thr protein kinase)
VVLLVSEVIGNSVRHSGSGAPGETVTVAVMTGDGVVWVEVTNRAGQALVAPRSRCGAAEMPRVFRTGNVHGT